MTIVLRLSSAGSLIRPRHIDERAIVHVDRAPAQLGRRRIQRVDETRRGGREPGLAQTRSQQVVADAVVDRLEDRSVDE